MHPAEAPPRASEKPSGGAPLSAAASLGVAAVTGLAVFAAGVYVVERRWPEAQPHAPAPQASSAAMTVARVATASPTPPAPASMTSATSAPTAAPPETAQETPAPTAAPPETAQTAQATPAPTAAQTTEPTARPARAGYGSLKVLSSIEDATVYVNGVAAGPSNVPIEVRCGRFFVRLGTPSPLGTKWLLPGKTVVIACEAASEVAF